MSNHPITPSSELIKQLETAYFDEGQNLDIVLIQAYQAGADQELELCKQVILKQQWFAAPGFRLDQLHNARRPKPPSLKEKGMASLDEVIECIKALAPGAVADGPAIETIRRALESLPD